MLLAGFIAFGLQVLQMNRPYSAYMNSLKVCNLTDTFMGCFLPLMTNQEKGLEILGLPKECKDHIGKTWYSPGMASMPCSEIRTISRYRVFSLLAEEPLIMYHMVKKFVLSTRPWIYLPHIEGYTGDIDWMYLSVINRCKADNEWFFLLQIDYYTGDKGWVYLPDLEANKGGHLNFRFPSFHWSFSHYIERLNQKTYMGIFAFSTIAFALCCGVIFFIRNQGLGNLVILILFSGLEWIYMFFSSLFGDGFVNANIHFYLGAVPLLLCTLFSGVLVMVGVRKFYWVLKNLVLRARSKINDSARINQPE